MPWLRIRFAKLGKVRFISHRDVARAWERAVRRVGLAVAWSKGFSPRPLLSFGLALPTGAESVAEYLDIRLEHPVERPELGEALSEALPPGMEVLVVARRHHGAGSLQQAVTSSSWELEVDGVSGEELAARVERFRASSSVTVPKLRKGTEVQEDVRPLVLDVAVSESGPETGSRPRLTAEVGAQPRGVRPAELVAALGTDLVLAHSRRTHQWIAHEGTRIEPLALDSAGSLWSVTPAPANERAS